jgi:hypothetical protein
MNRILTLLFGVLFYVIFLVTFLYQIGFVAGAVVPKTIDESSTDLIRQLDDRWKQSNPRSELEW